MYTISIGGISLPLAPEKISISTSKDNKKFNIVGLGEINLPGERNPSKIKWNGILPYGDGQNPAGYISGLNKLLEEKKPVKLMILRRDTAGQAIFDTVMDVVLESFDPEDNADNLHDIAYSISMVEYRPYSVKVTTNIVAAQPSQGNSGGNIVIGCNVLVNGRLHRDSWGRGPGKTLSNYKGKVNFIKTDGRSHPYHVTTPSGGWLGWVVPGAVKRI